MKEKTAFLSMLSQKELTPSTKLQCGLPETHSLWVKTRVDIYFLNNVN